MEQVQKRVRERIEREVRGTQRMVQNSLDPNKTREKEREEDDG